MGVKMTVGNLAGSSRLSTGIDTLVTSVASVERRCSASQKLAALETVAKLPCSRPIETKFAPSSVSGYTKQRNTTRVVGSHLSRFVSFPSRLQDSFYVVVDISFSAGDQTNPAKRI